MCLDRKLVTKQGWDKNGDYPDETQGTDITIYFR